MNKNRKFFGWVLILVLFLLGCLVTGCGQTESLSPDTEEQESTDTEEQNGSAQTERVFVDDDGREVVLPAEINKVMGTNHIATLLLYTINPDLIAGWNSELRPVETRFFDEKYHDLPILGSWYSGSTDSIEALLDAAPDLIISAGLGSYVKEYIEELQEQTNIPIIMLEAELDGLDHTYERLGDLLNEKTTTDRLGQYCKETYQEVSEKAKQIPEAEQVRVYCALGPDGLRTFPAGSHQSVVLDIVKGLNVAETDLPIAMGGMAEVSLEQILQWNPDVILSWDTGQGGYSEGILSDPDWKNISAVKNNKVYAMPYMPNNWFATPPSVNRILGLKWAGHVLYPEVFDYDLTEEVKEYFELFYHYQLSDDEAHELLKNSL